MCPKLKSQTGFGIQNENNAKKFIRSTKGASYEARLVLASRHKYHFSSSDTYGLLFAVKGRTYTTNP